MITPNDISSEARVWLSRLGLIAAIIAAPCRGLGQTPYMVTTGSGSSEGSLPYAIALANSGSINAITIQSGLGFISLTQQLFVYANVSISGNDNVITVNNSDRAFFLAGGEIAISDLGIINGTARGGDGVEGGGGGAGLGGAIFVANGQGISNLITSPTVVTLSRVTFENNRAIGGNGSENSTSAAGGGGGMGGDGGMGYSILANKGGGGGGGLGVGADGGTSDPEQPTDGKEGIFLPGNSSPAIAGGNGSTDVAHHAGGWGGLSGGGGGGANAASDNESSPGGGGGVGGESASVGFDTVGGAGGFGGGGGGGVLSPGGAGGFGGGGGGGEDGGAGGFGGGGGNSNDLLTVSGGFGGGNGALATFDGYSGGGLGAGGAIFVMKGASLNIVDSRFANNSVVSGTGGASPATNGSAIGSDLFLGADTTFTVSGTNTMTLSDLGGAGDLSDPNVANHANDPNAQGGLIKEGAGTLTMTGRNFFTGTTTVNAGTLNISGLSATAGYVVNEGTLVINADGNNVNQTMVNAGGRLVVNSGVQNLSGNLQVNAGGELQFDGSVTGFLSATIGRDGRLSGTGQADVVTLESEAILAPGSPSEMGTLKANTVLWSRGAIIEMTLGGSLLQVDTLAKGEAGAYQFLFQNIEGVTQGESYAVIGYKITQFDVTDFGFESSVSGLDGFFTQYYDEQLESMVVGFQVTAVPEPSRAGLLAVGIVVLTYVLRKSDRAGRFAREVLCVVGR